jgi:lipid-A-disaccharide synthase
MGIKIYLIAGEASGDLHGACLVEEIRRLFPGALFRGFGGDRMHQAGVEIVRHYRQLDFMGFSEVLANIISIGKNFYFCRQDILTWKPDAVILIDYPGFNLRIAPFIHRAGIKVIYYISPQLWAWHEARVKTIRRYVDHMLVILPFENDFYARHGVQVTYVGHPLLDLIPEKRELLPADTRRQVALLPGSRRQEIERMLPVMLRMIPCFPQCRFVVAGLSSVAESFYRSLMGDYPAELVMDGTYEVLSRSHAAIVTSGTATLETALHLVPMIVCYKGNRWSYAIARYLVRVPYISLVNLIAGKAVVTELIQEGMNEKRLKEALERLLYDESYRNEMKSAFRELRQKLGEPGAARRAAACIGAWLLPAPDPIGMEPLQTSV